MRIIFCGVRGSTPAPGPAFVRYGGNTSCVAVSHNGAVPTLILDAGTGIRRVSELLAGAPFQGTILLGHLHWDHTQGLPFFSSADNPQARVHFLIPGQGDSEEVLAQVLSPPHFPLVPSQLRGAWEFGAVEPGAHTFEGFSILAREIPHKGGRTFGYRITDGSSTFTYMSDHGPVELGEGPDGFGPYHDAAIELCEGVDVLIHDAQHTPEEFPLKSTWGHSPVDYAVGLAEKAGVRRLMLFHHDPARTDAELDEIVAGHTGRQLIVDAAFEGQVLDIPE